MRGSVRIPVLAATSAALLVPSLAVSAASASAASPGAGASPASSAGTASAPPARRPPSAPARPGTGRQASEVAAALRQARSSGRPVPLPGGTAADPDGSFTVTLAAVPARGLYQARVPSQLRGATVESASVTAGVACPGPARVTLSVTRPDGRPLAGGAWSASRGVACGARGASLPVTGAMQRAAGDGWRTITFRLRTPSGTKASSPSLRVTYVRPPAVPSGLAVSSGSLKDAVCAGSSSPAVAPGMAVTMRAGVYDSAGSPASARFTYWVRGSARKMSATSSPVLSGGTAQAVIPASFTRGLTKGSVVDWTATAVSRPSSSSSPSAVCAVVVNAAAVQGAPVISGGPSGDPVPGTQETWTVTAAAASQSGVTPTAVVWGLDAPPPVSGPPADQVISIAAGATSAQVHMVVPSSGPHAFYAYARYSDGSVSGTATSQFTAASDPAVSCPTFASALSGTGCVQADGVTPATSAAANQMIANGSGGTNGTADGDGSGNALPADALSAAGWTAGGTVTADGATFALPGFGTSASADDNLLAAGQTIGMPAGSQGTSLVFLAAATASDAKAPPPSGLGYVMSPEFPEGTSVAGQDCDVYQSGQGTGCVPAPEGTITYAAGSGAPVQNYDLEVPDWRNAASQAAVVTLPQFASGSGTQSGAAGLYAISVPLNPQAPVASVTLPDVGAVVQAAAGVPWSAVHIFGVAVANTTTATPGSLLGSVSPQAAGPWTGAWASPPEGSFAPQSGSSYGNQTIRLVTQASMGGTAVRLRLSDALAAEGTAPLSVGAVTVAQQSSGAAVSGTPVAVTFGGVASVTIPEGGDVYSDPVAFPATAGEELAVSIDLTGSYPSLPENTWCGTCTGYVSAPGSGNQTANTDGSQFSGTGTSSGHFSSVLTGVDVLTAGTPTVAVLGDGVIDGHGPGTATPVAGAPEVNDDLASALALQAGGPKFGVVGAGIESGQVMTDAGPGTGTYGGPAALSRLARDVLAEPGVGTVIIGEGTEDLLRGATEQNLYTNGLAELSRELTAWGITTIWTTATACFGFDASGDPCSPSTDTSRTTLNSDLLAQGLSPGEACASTGIPPCRYTADFAAAVGDTSTPQQLLPNADAGDHVNLTPAGYLAETQTIPVIAGQTPLAADVPPNL